MVSDKRGTLHGDQRTLTLAIENLIDNAIKYTPNGGAVSVQAARDGDHIRISVVDTGIGISHDEQAQIFGKFFRGKSVARMNTDGSGLGLYIVKSVVDQHGGTVSLTPCVGGGTNATIILPIALAGAPAG